MLTGYKMERPTFLFQALSSHSSISAKDRPSMTSLTTFHQFPRLPHELQSHIWSLACGPPPYSESDNGGINTEFLVTLSVIHINHPTKSDHHPSWKRHPPDRLPSLYECMFRELQYLSGYEDTWNLLGACVQSRRAVLEMLKREVESVPPMSEERERQRMWWEIKLRFEEARKGVVEEIAEVIGWLETKKGSGVFKDPTLDLREPHHMHAVWRGFIIEWGNVPYSESHPEVFQRPQPVMATPTPTPTPTTFHQFPLLPQEIRSHIWSLASLPLTP